MAIQKEIWANEIKNNVYPVNSFMMESIDDSVWVDGKAVHKPNQGADPEVVKDRVVVPAPIVKRTDTLASYFMSEFTSTPTYVPDIEQTEVTYDKRTNVTTQHGKSINKQLANWMAYWWATNLASNIIRTSGADRPANTPGATGNRKMCILDDLAKAKALFDDQDIDEDGRCILLPSHFDNDLINNNREILMSKDYINNATIENGIVKKLYGFKIYKRGKLNVLRYDNSGTPLVIDPTTIAAGDDNASAIFWHRDFVSRAKGAVKIFHNEADATLYGDVFSALARAGGQIEYNDQKGVGAIVEAAGA